MAERAKRSSSDRGPRRTSRPDLNVTRIASQGYTPLQQLSLNQGDGSHTEAHRFFWRAPERTQFMFRDKNGNVVFDFACDFISEAAGTLPGYTCLGATSGDGRMRTGNAGWILSATTSPAENLNRKGYCDSGNCSARGTKLLANSPATDADFTPRRGLVMGRPYLGLGSRD